MSSITAERRGKIAVLWLDKAPANGISTDMLVELDRHIESLAADGEVKAVVLASKLEKIFSAGADATWFNSLVQEYGAEGFPGEFEKFSNYFRDVCWKIHTGHQVYIAAINGHCVAGGLELAAACDLRFAASGVKLGLPELEIFGAIPSGGGGTQYIVRLVGPRKAFELIATAATISSDEGLEIGLVDKVFPKERLFEETLKFAERITSGRLGAGLAGAKKATLLAGELGLDTRLRLDKEIFTRQVYSEAFIGGVRDFTAQYGKKK